MKKLRWTQRHNSAIVAFPLLRRNSILFFLFQQCVEVLDFWTISDTYRKRGWLIPPILIIVVSFFYTKKVLVSCGFWPQDVAASLCIASSTRHSAVLVVGLPWSWFKDLPQVIMISQMHLIVMWTWEFFDHFFRTLLVGMFRNAACICGATRPFWGTSISGAQHSATAKMNLKRRGFSSQRCVEDARSR